MPIGMLPAQTGYQGLAENYLGMAGQQAGLGVAQGQQLANTGLGLYNQYLQTGLPSLRAATSAAQFNPDLVSQAGVTAQQQNDAAKAELTRQLTRMGVNPNSGRFAGLQQEAGLAGAANKAGAMTTAQRAERQASFGRLAQVAGLGMGLISPSLGAMSNAGNQIQNSAAGLEGVANQYGSLASGQAQAAADQSNAQNLTAQQQQDQMFSDLQQQTADQNAKWAAAPKTFTPSAGGYGGVGLGTGSWS